MSARLKAADEHPLRDFLALVVPIRILEYQSVGGPKEGDFRFARIVGEELATHGDQLLFREEKQEPGTARLAGRVAQAVAILAFCPGGVKLCGLHFDARTDPSDPSPGSVGGGRL